MCNREIKFDRLWSRARALNADYVATGHYARIEQGADGRFHLLRAADDAKDQSYFLFTLGQDELSRTIFPLGAMTKAEVRARARALGLANADKPESQEICFVPDGDYASFVERRSDSTATSPRLNRRQRRQTSRGSCRSASIHRRTAARPGYCERRAAVCPRDSGRVGRGRGGAPRDLDSAGLIAHHVSLVDDSIASGVELSVEVKIRYRHRAIPATMRVDPARRAEIRFTAAVPP